MRLIATFFLLLLSFTLHGQTQGFLLIISDTKAHLILDGEDLGYIEADKPVKKELLEGDHYVQLLHAQTGAEKSDIITVESGKQVIHKVQFGLTEEEIASNKFPVVDGHINIPGLMSDSNQEGSTIYHGFETGDQIVLDFDLVNNNGWCSLTVFTYPSGNVAYSTSDFQNLNEIKIDVKERGIYGFTLTTNNILDRTGHLQVWRKPQDSSSANFNTEVEWAEVHRPIVINEDENFYINSGRHSLFQGGKSRILLPISLPLGTSKWYYRVSSSRDKELIESTKNYISLAAELAELIDKTGTLSFGIEFLTDPPGADYCDIYLLNYNNSRSFLNKDFFEPFPQGTRENYKHGNVEVDCCLTDGLYLGIKNPDSGYGIHVRIEVVAIISSYELVMKG